MDSDKRNSFAVKTFLKEYLDLRKDKDNELETVDSIRKGVEIQGSQSLDSDIRHIHGFVGAECELHRCDYRCYAHLTADGTYYGCGAFRGTE